MKTVHRWLRCTACDCPYEVGQFGGTAWDESYFDPDGRCIHDFQPDGNEMVEVSNSPDEPVKGETP